MEVVVRNVPAGLGAPVFDKLEAELARACLSIPACKGFEVRAEFIVIIAATERLVTTVLCQIRSTN